MDLRNVSKVKKAAYIVTAVLISTFLIRYFILDSFLVIGNSMAPTLTNGDYIFVNKMAYDWHKPSRLDIVVVNFREMADKKAIKRIVGLPGEWIYIEKGIVYVANQRDGEKTEVGKLDTEDFTSTTSADYNYRLDPHEYFLLGDNGLTSTDSRELGPVDIYKIDGKVIHNVDLK